MARKLIQRYQVHQVRAVAPKDVDVEPNIALNDAAGVISCEFKVYDPSRDEIVSADEASGQTVISVTNAGVFNVDDMVEITELTGVLLYVQVLSVDTANGTITVNSGLGIGANAGARVRKVFGPAIAMTEYGVADLDERDWGYKGSFLGNHVAHLDDRATDGLDVDIEINFDGGTNLEAFQPICATIKQDDCG